MSAQENLLDVRIKAGDNASFGFFSSFSAAIDHRFADDFSLKGGAQYNTIGRTALELRPHHSFSLWDLDLYTESLFHYANQSSINTIAAGLGLGYSSSYLSVFIGYYYRHFFAKESNWAEEANLYYKFCLSLIPFKETSDIFLYVTNSEMFELERHYQPSLVIQYWKYINESLGIGLGLSYKPAGMFHLTSDYYQTYLNFGLCYSW